MKHRSFQDPSLYNLYGELRKRYKHNSKVPGNTRHIPQLCVCSTVQAPRGKGTEFRSTIHLNLKKNFAENGFPSFLLLVHILHYNYAEGIFGIIFIR